MLGLHAGQVEVTDLHAPVLVHQQVGRLEVPVDDLLAVQLQHPLGSTTGWVSRQHQTGGS